MPDGSILVGLIVAVNPLDAETVRSTVLPNPFTVCRLIVDVPELPAAMLRLVGFARIVKSAWFENTLTDIVIA